MKKIILTGILSLSVLAMFGQSKNVRSADYAIDPTNPSKNFEKAQADIEAALQNPETANDAKTWYVAGKVYDAVREKEWLQEQMQQSYDKKLRGESTIKALDYFVKAYELDQLPNEKGKVKPRYDKEIVKYLSVYPGELINYGFYWNDEREYDKTIAAWEKYLDMAKLPYMKGIVPESDADTSTYNKVEYYTAIVAIQSDNTDKAIQHFEVIKDKYNINECYQYLAQQYLVKKDTTSYFNTIKSGFEKYPTNTFMLESLVNYYVLTGNDLNEGLNYLNEAIKLNPNMAQYYCVRGNIYDAQQQFEKAKNDYDKTVELDSNNALAHFGLGKYYYKRAELAMERVGNIRDPKVLNTEKEKVKDIYQTAAGEFEKCRTADAKNCDNLNLLKQTYFRIYQDTNNPKYKEANQAWKDCR
ncbi:MAG: tetratricopeptide repeat protein [Prevotellaceae bacterium]|jgi:tetratricopeptide (TPR) repeat protein|nr:tetratricopeptide repeat protein [Prevotellaceae bacterium]